MSQTLITAGKVQESLNGLSRKARKDVVMDFRDFDNVELMKLRQIAIETRDGRYIKAIKEKMNRRVRET
jgi:hypothetical protein